MSVSTEKNRFLFGGALNFNHAYAIKRVSSQSKETRKTKCTTVIHQASQAKPIRNICIELKSIEHMFKLL